uniref:Polymerase PB2 n=1 Tax=Orthomyxoviridae sp. TaxID=1955168 RepID=A0A8G0VT14_9ORTO|nr:MAG: polymerase PB2 [Orthomyxoviridae sp.]
MTDTYNKQVLLALCKKLKEASPRAIEILRTQPLCNLKMVQRKAKNVKDPNPLASMMSTISMKYPISVDVERARDINMPTHFLHDADAHQHGRVLCKLEAVEWYINNATLPSENIKKAIDVLYEGKREQVRFFYSFNWESAHVRYGVTYIQRQLINMQEVNVSIPRHLKTDYIMAVLMPQYILDYGQLSPSVLTHLEKIRDLTLVSKMTIQSQLRILLNTLDSKPRYVPCLPNETVKVNRIRHSFASSMYVIHVSKTHLTKDSTHKDLVNKLGQAIHILLSRKEDHKKMYNYLCQATFEGEDLLQVCAPRKGWLGRSNFIWRIILKLEIGCQEEILSG